MIKRKLIVILLCLSMLVCGSGLIYGMATTSVINEFETGIVDIGLNEYQIVDGKEEDWSDGPLIMPGDTVSKIPRIDNDGNDCYVRVKITFRDTDVLNETDLFGIDSKWVKADDGYWYYTDILPHGETVDVFAGLFIPTDFPQDCSGDVFYIDIDADAIQSKNFEPDFESANPWGNIEILECEKEGQYDISTFKPSDDRAFEIVYLGDVDKLVKNEDDFFVNFPYLMPGDTYSDSVVLENDSDDDITMYFHTEAIDDSELLEKIQLKITTVIDGKTVVVYEGPLQAEDLQSDIALGVIPAGDSGEFKFEINVPAELNNKYTIMSSEVKWVFYTELPDGTDPTEPDGTDPTDPTEPDVPSHRPQTGNMDVMWMWIFFWGFLFSGIGLIYMFFAGRKGGRYVEYK